MITPATPRHPVYRAALAALLAFVVVAVAGVLLRPALPIDETRYLAVAWEMWTRGDWLVPTKNFDLYTHKPPLLFWTMNLVWAVTGVSEIAARLVGPGFAVLTLLLTGGLAGRLWPDRPDIRARTVLALTGLLAFALYGGLTMFDTALAAATVAGLLALLQAIRTGQLRYWVLLGGALAAGGLAKGPVILIHLGPAVALAPIWARGLGELTLRQLGRGAAVALGTGLAVVALWVVPAAVSGGAEYRNAILWTQSAGRIADAFAHARPWWFFAALLPVLLFPWVFVPAVWRAGSRLDWRDPGLRLCVIWFAAAALLFSLISSKQAHYLIPEMPAVALVVARLAPRDFSVRVPALIIAAVALAGIAVTLQVIPAKGAEAFIQPRPAAVTWCLLMLAGCIAAVRMRGLAGGVVLTLGTLLCANLLIGFSAVRALHDTQRIAALIAPFQPAGIAVFTGSYNAEFNFAGRLTQSVATLASAEERAAWQTAHPTGVIVAPLDAAHPSWPPARTVAFRDALYGVWHIADAPPRDAAAKPARSATRSPGLGAPPSPVRRQTPSGVGRRTRRVADDQFRLQDRLVRDGDAGDAVDHEPRRATAQVAFRLADRRQRDRQVGDPLDAVEPHDRQLGRHADPRPGHFAHEPRRHLVAERDQPGGAGPGRFRQPAARRFGPRAQREVARIARRQRANRPRDPGAAGAMQHVVFRSADPADPAVAQIGQVAHGQFRSARIVQHDARQGRALDPFAGHDDRRRAGQRGKVRGRDLSVQQDDAVGARGIKEPGQRPMAPPSSIVSPTSRS